MQCRVTRFVCVCERERERERERESESESESESARERERERERGSHHSGISCLNHGLFVNTYEHHHCVCHATLFPFRA